MAQLGLNITDGRVEFGTTGEGKDGSAGGDIEIWAVAAVHACTNHACTPPPTRRRISGGGGGPNVRPDFVSTPGVGLTHRAIAIRRIAPGEELTRKPCVYVPLCTDCNRAQCTPYTPHTVLVYMYDCTLGAEITEHHTVHNYIHAASCAHSRSLMLVYIHTAC